MRVLLAIGGLLILVNTLGFSRTTPKVYGPGVIAPGEPLQLETEVAPFKIKDFIVTPLADYEVKGRVLARNSYWLGTEAELSPLDLALGWNQLSDQEIIDELNFSISNRFLRWEAEELPLPYKELNEQLSNNHLIPSSAAIERQLDRISVGQLVTLRGQLVKVERPDGWRWHSSLNRTDTGRGACELLYVTSVSMH